MLDPEIISKTKLLAALHSNPASISAHHLLLALYDSDLRSYPHIALLAREQARSEGFPTGSLKHPSLASFSGVFGPPKERPAWMCMQCVERARLEQANPCVKHRLPQGSSLDGKRYKREASPEEAQQAWVRPNGGVAYGRREKENEPGKEAGGVNFVKASKIIPKGKLGRATADEDEESKSQIQTETGKNGKKRFVTPFADPEKRETLAGKRRENPERSNEKKSEKKRGEEYLIDQIESEILDRSPSVQWDDIIGLDYAKQTIEEILILPIAHPELRELTDFPKGMLLFGPPGTGKTMIAKAVASQCQSTFFNISASILTSKWMGEGEKLVRMLFEIAKQRQPSIIFIDEIDSLLCARSESDFESSRRLKTEFLVRMEGVSSSGQDDQVIIIGATNRPQELDEAVRRRLPKRLYIPLPNKAGRADFLSKSLVKCKLGSSLSPQEVDQLAAATKGYSGADLKALVSEAKMYPVRLLALAGKKNISISEIRKICFDDFKSAIGVVKATVSQEDLGKYLEWNTHFGSYPFSATDLDT